MDRDTKQSMKTQDLAWIYSKENMDFKPGESQPVYNSRVENYENEQGQKDEYFCGNNVMSDLDDIIQFCNPKRKLDIIEESMNLNDIVDELVDPPDDELRKYQCDTCLTWHKYREQKSKKRSSNS